jgi:hypothetical protein
MADRQLEAPPARPSEERTSAPDQISSLASETPAAMTAYHDGRKPRCTRQFNRLRKLSRRRLDPMPAPLKLRDERAKEGNVRRVCQVNPDKHLSLQRGV